MLSPARTLLDIRRICSPRPLVASQLRELYVETDAGRDPDQSVRETLLSLFGNSEETQSVLVYGHRGSGKSTELAKFTQDLGEGWFVVAFSILEDLPSVGVRAEDLLLALAYRLIEKARKEEPALDVDEKGLQQILDFFRKKTIEIKESRKSESAVEAGVKAGTGTALAGLLDLFFKYRSEVKFGADRSEAVVEHLRKRPADLIEGVNALVDSVSAALEKRGQHLLLIVEDLDKLTIADARGVFIENTRLLAELRANVIYTIPIFTFYSPDAGVMKAAFNHFIGFPMLKVCNQANQPAEGAKIVRDIILRRVDERSITLPALDLLITKTGGVLRHVFEVLQIVTTMTTLREPPIGEEQVRYALNRLRSDLGTQIALPDAQLGTVKDLYDKLVECETRRRANQPCPPTGDPLVQVLLRCCALVEYNGERWLAVHPLVVEYLESLDLIAPNP